MAPSYENIELDRAGSDGRVGRITLNRPDKMNALSQELLFEFNDALHDYEADSDVRVIIVRGAGRAFSSGYDLAPARGGADAVVRAYKGRDDQGRRLVMGTRTGMQQITDIHMYFWNMSKVTVAQVHGYAIAGGCELAMMADLVVAAEDAQLGHPGLRGLGTSRTGVIWPLVIGMRKAKELYYTGDNVTGRRGGGHGDDRLRLGVRGNARADAQHEPAVEQVIDHRRLCGDGHWMVVEEAQNAGTKRKRSAAIRDAGDKGQARGDRFASISEMLSYEGFRVAEPVRQHDSLLVLS